MTASTRPLWEASLPENSCIEHLRKEAKSVLKAFRSGDVRAGELAARLDKFSGATPKEILDGDLCLREVQHALALHYGFKSWKNLKARVESAGAAEEPGRSVIESIIREAVLSRGSDIHFEWSHGRLAVRLRVDGALRDAKHQIAEGQEESAIDEIKGLACLDPAVKNRAQNGMARLKVNDLRICLRVSLLPYVTGESVVMRIWDDSSFAMEFGRLGFNQEQAATVKRWMEHPNGIIAFTGPAGSGKTTTLYGALGQVDTTRRKIVTAEDPVYILLDGVSQLQIDPSEGMTYARAIREQMHQDIDIMMVGECRDKEVLDLICRVALTGHLVVTQLHSNTPPHAIHQLLNMGGDPYALDRTIVGILSQRLVRKICPDCREEYQPEDWEREGLGIDAGVSLFKGKGCDTCRGTGYRGRTAVYELLELNDALRAAIVKNASLDELTALARESGMPSLKENGMQKALEGVTTVDEVLRVCG